MRLLTSKRNRDIISWLGAGVAMIAGGAWAVYTYLAPVHPPNSPKPVSCTVEANQSVAGCERINVTGGIQIGGTRQPSK